MPQTTGIPEIGEEILYVLNNPLEGLKPEVRPGKILRAWGNKLPPNGTGYINAIVFIDGSNDRKADSSISPEEQRNCTMWKTSIGYDPSGKPGTWHYPGLAAAGLQVETDSQNKTIGQAFENDVQTR